MIQRPEAHAVVYVLDRLLRRKLAEGRPAGLGPGQKAQRAVPRKSPSN